MRMNFQILLSSAMYLQMIIVKFSRFINRPAFMSAESDKRNSKPNSAWCQSTKRSIIIITIFKYTFQDTIRHFVISFDLNYSIKNELMFKKEILK